MYVGPWCQLERHERDCLAASQHSCLETK
jgi:hypothetical protein